MKADALRQKSKAELEQFIRLERGRLEDLRAKLHQKKLKNVKEIPAARKDIARAFTILRTHLKNAFRSETSPFRARPGATTKAYLAKVRRGEATQPQPEWRGYSRKGIFEMGSDQLQ